MKLQYRGQSYESHPQIIDTIETGVTGIFRGQTYQVHRLLGETCSQPHMNLKYRGVAYTVKIIPVVNLQELQKKMVLIPRSDSSSHLRFKSHFPLTLPLTYPSSFLFNFLAIT